MSESKLKKNRLEENYHRYFIVISEISLKQIIDYKNKLSKKELEAGLYLLKEIERKYDTINIENVSLEKFIGLLLATKRPKFFTGKDGLKCDGSDWTYFELKLLGDINICMPVRIFDNGIWVVSNDRFKIHDPPFEGHLLFSPGPLLKKNKKLVCNTPEYDEVIVDNEFKQGNYNDLIERRLAPLFQYASEDSKIKNNYALITIPGLGCGVFAGKFKGTLGKRLDEALRNILRKHSKHYTNIKCVYFDPYFECKPDTAEFNGIKYKVRPFNEFQKSQLCKPEEYMEDNDNFTNCILYKIVAWDHLAYPGNDFFINKRITDDGMSAAATNSMEVITGISGTYTKGGYSPPNSYKTWEQVVNDSDIKLVVEGNIRVVSINDGKYLTLDEFLSK